MHNGTRQTYNSVTVSCRAGLSSVNGTEVFGKLTDESVNERQKPLFSKQLTKRISHLVENENGKDFFELKLHLTF